MRPLNSDPGTVDRAPTPPSSSFFARMACSEVHKSLARVSVDVHMYMYTRICNISTIHLSSVNHLSTYLSSICLYLSSIIDPPI